MQGDPQWVAESLGLKRAGSEYKGPCPICGGVDRFHVKTGKSSGLLLYCRRGCTYAELMRELEKRGIIEKDPVARPQHRRDDLITADHWIAVMEGALARGHKMKASDRLALGWLITKVDEPRRERLRELRDQFGAHDEGIQQG